MSKMDNSQQLAQQLLESEKYLIASQQELLHKNEELEKKNFVLREMLNQLEVEKKQIADAISANINEFVMPTLDKLKVRDENEELLALIKKSLQNILSNFGSSIINLEIALTPREREICNMIKNGLANKTIAKLLFISVETVAKHRKNIRKKLKLTGSKYNLSTYLDKL